MVNKAIADAIWLKKCLIQKQAEQADYKNDIELSKNLWGQNEALNWIIDLLDICNNKIQYDFVKMTNNICDLYENEEDKKC